MRRGSRDTRAESLLPDVSGPSASGGSMGVLDVARSLSASLQVRTQQGTTCLASQGCWTLKPASRERADPCWLEGMRPAWWCIASMTSRLPLKGKPCRLSAVLFWRVARVGHTVAAWPNPAANPMTCRPHCSGAAPASSRQRVIGRQRSFTDSLPHCCGISCRTCARSCLPAAPLRAVQAVRAA